MWQSYKSFVKLSCKIKVRMFLTTGTHTFKLVDALSSKLIVSWATDNNNSHIQQWMPFNVVVENDSIAEGQLSKFLPIILLIAGTWNVSDKKFP